MRLPLIITLCFAMLVSSTPIQVAAQNATLTAAAPRKMANSEFRKLILAKAKASNMTIRQRLQLRTGLAFFGDEIQEAVEARLAYDGKGIGDGDIDWAKLFEQILEFIKLLLELFGTTDGGDGGVIIGASGIILNEPIVEAPAMKPIEEPDIAIVMTNTESEPVIQPPKVITKTRVIQQKPVVIPTVPMHRVQRVQRVQQPNQSRVIYSRPMTRIQQNCLV